MMVKMKELIGLEDLPHDFKVYLEDGFRKELISKAVKSAGGFVRLSKVVDFDWSSLCKLRRGYRILKGRRSAYFIKISLLMKLLELVGLTLEDIEKSVVGAAYSKHMVKVRFPILASPKLASLVGHAIGDGYVSTERFKYVSKTKELVHEVKGFIHEIFGTEGSDFIDREIYYRVEFPGIVSRLLHLTGVPLGRKVTQEFKVPEWIKSGSKEIKSAFVKALFDDEGSFILGKKQQFISISMYKRKDLVDNHKEFLGDVRRILLELCIEPGKVFFMKEIRGTKEFGFGIYRKHSLMMFANQIGFTHQIKSDRLTKFTENHLTKV